MEDIMRITLNNDEFMDIECCWKSNLSPKKECVVEYGNFDEDENEIIQGSFFTDFVELLKALGFSPYQIKEMIDFLYENTLVLSISKIKFKLEYSLKNRMTREKVIVGKNTLDLIKQIENKENNASL